MPAHAAQPRTQTFTGYEVSNTNCAFSVAQELVYTLWRRWQDMGGPHLRTIRIALRYPFLRNCLKRHK